MVWNNHFIHYTILPIWWSPKEIFLPKFLIFEIHNGRYLAKKSKKCPNNTDFSVHLANSKCFTIPKMC